MGAGSCRPLAWVAAGLLALGLAPARAQRVPVLAEPGAARQLNEDVAYSLFLLTNGGFTSAGYVDYRDDSTTSKINVVTLPLRLSLDTGALGPIELRLTPSYGEAKTTTLLSFGGPAGPLATDRQYIALWNLRLDIGRPVTLAPGLVLTPLAGLGTQHWNGKLDRAPVGGSAVQAERVDFWNDALVTEAGAILEYHHRRGEVNIRPGASVSYVYLSSIDGRATVLPQGMEPARRGKSSITADSTVLRAALRVDGPLGLRLGSTELRWQGFVVGNYSTAAIGLFPWSVEMGLAVGAGLGAVGRRLVGFDPGEAFIGASYITGENFSGVRANFGFRF